MKKLLFVIPNLSTGGTNSSLDSLYSRLKTRYDISVFAISHVPCDHNYSFCEVLFPQDRKLSLLYSDFDRLPSRLRIAATFIKTLRNIFKFFNVDFALWLGRQVVHTIEKNKRFDWVVSFQEGYATRITALFNNPNKVAWIHCNYDMYLAHGLSEESIYRKYSKIVCVSNFTASVFSKRYPSLKDRTLSIYNLLDTEHILRMAEYTEDNDCNCFDGITLLSVGRFSPVKRFREIPHVASVLKDKGLKFKWYVIGPADGTEEGSLFINNMRKFDVSDCVKWVGKKSNPYPYFNFSNIYVCLSETEACPMVFMEAKLFGLPIVTTCFPSAYEFVHEGEGIITSIDLLPESISEMINQIETKFTPIKNVDNSQEVLKKVYELFS